MIAVRAPIRRSPYKQRISNLLMMFVAKRVVVIDFVAEHNIVFRWEESHRDFGGGANIVTTGR